MMLLQTLADKDLAVRSKVWLELDGRPFLGEGRYNILKTIDRYGSITRAAEETGVSYRRIRGAICSMERTIGLELVTRTRGGREGGNALVTEVALELMGLFEKQERGIRESVDELHRRTFGEHGQSFKQIASEE